MIQRTSGCGRTGDVGWGGTPPLFRCMVSGAPDYESPPLLTKIRSSTNWLLKNWRTPFFLAGSSTFLGAALYFLNKSRRAEAAVAGIVGIALLFFMDSRGLKRFKAAGSS